LYTPLLYSPRRIALFVSKTLQGEGRFDKSCVKPAPKIHNQLLLKQCDDQTVA
jgi:hypothetical protein